MKEADIMRLIQVKATRMGLRLFRNNTGMGWAGKIIKFSKPMMVKIYPGDVVIKKAYPLRTGLIEGSGDLIGLNNSGRFISAEIKTPQGKPTIAQLNFANFVNQFGGIGIIAESSEDFEQKYIEIINK